MKLLKVLTSAVLVCGIFVMPATASANEMPPQNSEGRQLASYEGVLTHIFPFAEADGSDSADRFFLRTEINGDSDNIIVFTVSGTTQLVSEASLAPGATIRASYDANMPVILIYPPRYNAVSVEVLQPAPSDYTAPEIKDGLTQGGSGATPFPMPTAPTVPDVPDEQTEDSADKITLLVNGKFVEGAFAFNDNGVVMVPLRAVAGELGHAVNWNADTKSVEVGQFISLTVGQDAYNFARMAPIKLGNAPVIVHETTYVPLGFFTEVMREVEYEYEAGSPLKIFDASHVFE